MPTETLVDRNRQRGKEIVWFFTEVTRDLSNFKIEERINYTCIRRER